MIPPVGPEISLIEVFKIILKSFQKTNQVLILNNFLFNRVKHHNFWHFNKARSAIQLSLKAASIKKPDKTEVLVSIYTCNSVLQCIINAGLKPIVYDVEISTLGSLSESIEEKISDRTLAIIANGLYGIAIDILKIKKISEKKNIYLIEDASQNFLSVFENKLMGTTGDMNILSYGLSKPIHSIGGGSLICNNLELIPIIDDQYKKHNKFGVNDFLSSLKKLVLLPFVLNPYGFKIFTLFFNRFDFNSHEKITIKKIGKIQLCALVHELNKIDSTNKIRNKNFIQLVEIINNKEDLKALEFNFEDNNFLRLPVICSKERKKWIYKIRSCGIWASDEIYQSTCSINSENVNSFKNYTIIKDQLILVSIHPLISEKNLDKLTRIN